MGLAHQYNTVLLDVALAAWDVSARLIQWALRRDRRPGADQLSRASFGSAYAHPTEDMPLERCYAPSTVRRYRQIAARFAAWDEQHSADRSAAPDFARFLVDATAAAGRAEAMSAGGRRDPRHLALLRTTICAVRATVDRPMGLHLTAGIQMPPRASPVSAADPDTVAALRRAVQSVREKLLITLACDLGLVPGQMVGLRWEDVSLHQSCVCVNKRRGRLEVDIPAACLARLRDCARGRAPKDLLFPSPYGGGDKPATVRTLQNALLRLAWRAGVVPGTTFSTLRKACQANASPTPPRAATLPMRPAHRGALCSGPRQAVPIRRPSQLLWRPPSLPVRLHQPLAQSLSASTRPRAPSWRSAHRRPP